MKIRAPSNNLPSVRVAMIEPVGGHGGNEFYDFGLCEHLGKHCDVLFYTCNETTLHKKFHLKTKTYIFYKKIYGKSPALLRGLRYLYATLKTLIHSKNNNVNITHVHIYHFSWREFIVVLLVWIFKIKVVATIHDVESFIGGVTDKKSRKNALKFIPLVDQFIVHSQYAFDHLISFIGSNRKSDVHIVPHGDVDFLYLRPSSQIEARKSLDLPESLRIILFFGQIKKVKGLDILLDAFSKVSVSHQNCLLLVVGKPWKIDSSMIEQRINSLGIDHRVMLNMSYIENEDVPKYFSAADFVVLPYLKIYSSGVLLRALDYGSPVIVSDLPPLVDIISDGVNGRIFKAGDPVSLQLAIGEMLDNDFLLKKYSDAGKQIIKEKYSWDMIASRTFSVYCRALRK